MSGSFKTTAKSSPGVHIRFSYHTDLANPNKMDTPPNTMANQPLDDQHRRAEAVREYLSYQRAIGRLWEHYLELGIKFYGIRSEVIYSGHVCPGTRMELMSGFHRSHKMGVYPFEISLSFLDADYALRRARKELMGDVGDERDGSHVNDIEDDNEGGDEGGDEGDDDLHEGGDDDDPDDDNVAEDDFDAEAFFDDERESDYLAEFEDDDYETVESDDPAPHETPSDVNAVERCRWSDCVWNVYVQYEAIEDRMCKLGAAVDDLIAASNAMEARGELQRSDSEAQAREEEFLWWAKRMDLFANRVRKMWTMPEKGAEAVEEPEATC